ncbi:Cna B-type domain-containing protein [Collinsella tanakaei]|uniref:Cna B-type domain-containing protein n=1 Tax=Collinsella tanakaei TaxID=626935 RepID=UPI0002D96BD1|nr:Cna B-type domain-containing protein [Collinsella tanakaei]
MLVADRDAVDALGGRDFVGQSTAAINGVTYILIGNEQQLRAIGSGKHVISGTVYQVEQEFKGALGIGKWEDISEVQVAYAGDADVTDGTLRDKEFHNSIIEHPLLGGKRTLYFTEGENGERDDALEGRVNTGLTYSIDANYLIFRDIDLSTNAADPGNTGWDPLMFSSTMLGAKSDTPDTPGSLWSCIGADGKSITDVTTVANPVISNVKVVQSGAKLDVSKNTGIGFFGTISNKLDGKNPFAAPTKATASNITLEKVTVENHATEVLVDQSLISGLLKGLGTVVGGLVSTLLEILTLGKIDLSGLIENLLNVRAADPSALATGSFAGRIVGDVEVSGCEVHEAKVSSVAQMNGGFAGYVQGDTQYASESLGKVVELLAHLLNVIPGLGLGDLITLLLDSNIIDAGALVPNGYLNPVISHCAVHNFAAGETIGSANNDYAGGFAGVMVGAIAQDCSVESANPYKVTARLYAGGFAGLMRNDVMKGALSEVGVELVRVAQPQSAAAGCVVRSGVTVTAASYAGGFAGAMANSYAVDAAVEGTVNVSATGHEEEHDGQLSIKALAGGFTGAATVGWATDLGQGENKNSDLLTGVNGLLTGLLTSKPEAAQNLLSLVGVEESKLLGVQMKGDFTVHSANDFAGGIVGRGDGVVIAKSDQDHLDDIKLWSQGAVVRPATDSPVTLNGLRSVVAGQTRAGGVAGMLGTASVGGIINGTVGLGGYLPFELSDVTVLGVAEGATVTAADSHAAGAVAEATGGSCTNVHIKDIASVEAGTRAGGFAAVMGPGNLAGSGGLDLLGLGAVSITGLLAVGQGVSVTAENCTVTGHANGFTVEATKDVASDAGVSAATAGGFVADNHSAQLSNCNVVGLHRVSADADNGAAGGFVGNSETGGLADVADDASILALSSISGLLSAVPYLIPKYSDCNVTYAVDGDATVVADEAGGFAGVFRSGVVEGMPENDADADQWAVNNLKSVEGGSYAGGFAGLLTSGALAAAADGGGGLSILGGIKGLQVDLSNLLSLIDAYVATVSDAGVNSLDGFTVRANRVDAFDTNSGAAGGFAGYASGAQISNCDVNKIAHTAIKDPADLEADAIDAYYDATTPWAIDGLRYAGGYAGRLDIGSTASVGKGLGILGTTINLTDVLSALNVMVSTVEHSDVYGMPGGYAVRATTADGSEGYAGGFAGRITGAHIQDSSAHSFSHVVGRIAAGGYTGGMEPGSVAEVLGGGESSILKKLANIDSLAGLVESFVPTVRNSSTDCVPCGGVVRAQAESDGTTMRGMAGGYAGYNEGGQIWGNDSSDWKAAAYTGPTRTAFADRMRSVFGTEVAGGYIGFMRPADTADTGSLSLLFGLIKVDTLASALSVVYPTQRQTRVTGPLSGIDVGTWNTWVDYVGVNGGFGADLAQTGKVNSQEELDAKLANYIYGYNVAAGRSAYSNAVNECDGGVAGGYVGIMRSGVVSDGAANDAKTVRAMRAAGGYAGFMESGGAANLGGVSILGLKLNLGQLVSAAQVFVPSIQGSSSTTGYREGMTVQARGTGSVENDEKYGCGHAGGYVGYAEGAQIWGDTEGATGCNVGNLRLVKGTNTVGGYAGTAAPGSAIDANTNASNGLLQGILDTVIGQPGDVANVLEATMTTIRGASVTSADEAWGFVVDGSYQQDGETGFAAAAGGFVGSCESAVLGSKEGASKLSVNGLRGVSGGKNAGGFVGLADVGSVADVGGTDAGTNKTSILSLIGLGNVSVLDAFRSYIYHASVTGVADGAQVRANTADTVGTMDSLRYFGNAGGFAGSLLNGSVKDCTVSALSTVTAPSYAGGFAGYMGKNSTVDIDEAEAGIGQILNLLKLQAGALDVWGSHADRCRVEGVASGFTVTSGTDAGQDIVEQGNDAAQNIAGGFVGLGDLSKIDACEVSNLGIVRSDQVAAGFIGQTDMSFIVNTQVDSVVVELLLVIVDQLVKALYLDDLQNLGVIDLSSFILPGLGELLGLKILSDGDLLYVNLLGLRIGVALAKADSNDPAQSDTAIITIGDSTIKLPCNEDGLINPEDNKANLGITLIKGNRTTVTNCKVTGAHAGYDVFGGGATQDADGAAVEGGLPADKNQRPDNAGYAGGFVGHNKEGLFEGNQMVYCDVVRGTSELVGPFSGMTNLQSYYFKDASAIEGADNEGRYNLYSIYRDMNAALTDAVAKADGVFSHAQQDTASGTDYNRYEVQHYDKISSFDELEGAVMQDEDGTAPVAMEAYVSPAKAVLMDDALNTPGTGGITPEPGEGQDPCSALADITLQKVWMDNANAGNTRPDEVTFKLKRTYTNADGVVVDDSTFGTNGILEVKLTAADASEWSETWRKVVGGLPVAFEDKTVYPSVVRYYTYSVEEVQVGSYEGETSYSYSVAKDETGYVITVTNRLPLPETGGMGTWFFMFAGAALMTFGLYERRRRRLGSVGAAFNISLPSWTCHLRGRAPRGAHAAPRGRKRSR